MENISVFKKIKETIDVLTSKINSINPAAIGAAVSNHTHDDRYYTENEVDTKLNSKANSSHGNHVPTAETPNNTRFLRNDNTWQAVTPGNIGAAASSHTHNYAGSSSAGGAATSADKLNTNAGNATTPVYFSNGVPVACSSSIGGTGAYITESEYNTDGSWYRKWSDGFIEQGGEFLAPTYSFNTYTRATLAEITTGRTVTLVKPFTTTTYQVVFGAIYYIDEERNPTYQIPMLRSRTTTTFRAMFHGADYTGYSWYAYGK